MSSQSFGPTDKSPGLTHPCRTSPLRLSAPPWSAKAGQPKNSTWLRSMKPSPQLRRIPGNCSACPRTGSTNTAAQLPSDTQSVLQEPGLLSLPCTNSSAAKRAGPPLHYVEAGARATPCSWNADVRAVAHRYTPPPNSRLAGPCGRHRRDPLQRPRCSPGDRRRRNAGRFRPMVGSRCR